jgi:hypothetical protein
VDLGCHAVFFSKGLLLCTAYGKTARLWECAGERLSWATLGFYPCSLR